FSYGDYVRAGAVARFSPIMRAVKAHADRGGRVLGICNGFQILCEAGLLPGALLRNENQRFVCKHQYLRCETTDSALTSALTLHQVVSVPIAHAEGRYHIDDQGLNDLWNNDQVLFRYANAEGVVSSMDNPNGSRDHIAGIRNKRGNVFGMMPHPERSAEDILGISDGKLLFKGLISSVEQAAV
ncbi:MAG: phosphoribosylformylglycinamidine synthase subunit PurQ, partial [Bacteroidota bacterium]